MSAEFKELPILDPNELLKTLLDKPGLLSEIKTKVDSGDKRQPIEILMELNSSQTEVKIQEPVNQKDDLEKIRVMNNETFMKEVLLKKFTRITAQALEQSDLPPRSDGNRWISLWEGVTFKRDEGDKIIWERKVPKELNFLYENIDTGKLPAKHALRSILKKNNYNNGSYPYSPKKSEWYLCVEKGLDPKNILVILNSGTDYMKEDTRGTNTAITLETSEDVALSLVERLLDPDKNVSIDMLRKIIFEKQLGIGNEYKFGREYDGYFGREERKIVSPNGTLESIKDGSYKKNPNIWEK